MISQDDLNLYRITDNTDEAVKIITRFYRNFQSTRFVKDLFVIRLKYPPSDSAIAAPICGSVPLPNSSMSSRERSLQFFTKNFIHHQLLEPFFKLSIIK